MNHPDLPSPNGSQLLDHEALIERVVEALDGAAAKTSDSTGARRQGRHPRLASLSSLRSQCGR